MSLIREGHNVQVHYKGTLSDGTEFDNSKSRGTPLQFKVGSGQLIKGFDEAVKGMGLGEVKTFTVDAANAYGYHDPEGVQEYPKSEFPEGFKFVNGETVEGHSATGAPLVARIVSSTKDSVTLDLNHPLAGKDLTFEVEILSYDEQVTEGESLEDEPIDESLLEEYLENPQTLEDEEG
tara:strand:- start:824 stop:1357 length:534 start_codon:yes stop_codon:yes gene_type:complete